MIKEFFDFAHERHSIYLRRKAGKPRHEWTSDPILSTYKFTNVYRELDRTTVWFRENVRNKLPPEQHLLATVVFRWFNRIETGERIFNQYTLDHPLVPWDMYWQSRDIFHLKDAILAENNKGPYVTGAYIIKTPDGMNKLDGVLWCIEKCRNWLDDKPFPTDSLEKAWNRLLPAAYMGPFMAYEVVTDLRWSIMHRASDIMTWANPGPGANRGLQRIRNEGALCGQISRAQCIQSMRDLLQDHSSYWPREWPAWEMREVEHTLCEFDKYMRVKRGEGKPRGVYR